jgi:thiol-disulfide isomerase/thioredoxin
MRRAIHTMRIKSVHSGLLLVILPAAMIGCTQPLGVRSGTGNDIKTIASVGDKPLPIRSGTPVDSVRAEDPAPLVTQSSRGRISGRVYDERGKPVANARVRLAVGAEAGGKALSSTTDRSGAFTIRGLRPGSSYTVIAEYEGTGGLMTGRFDTTAPDADVRIGLKRRALEADDARSSVRPARPGVAPISSVEETDESGQDEEPLPRLNHEDLEPPAPEAEAMRGDEARPAPRISASTSGAGRGTGWTQRPRLAPAQAAAEGRGRPGADRSQARGFTDQAPGDAGADDEVNPLPPALEPENVGASEAARDSTERTVALARNEGRNPAVPDRSRALAQGAAPRPFPRGVVSEARSVSPEAYAPLSISDPEEVPRTGAERAGKPASSVNGRASSRGVSGETGNDQPRPTWGELSFQRQPIPLDESLQKVSREMVANPSPGRSSTSATASPASATAPAPARPPALAVRTGPFCDFDPIERTLRDFQLPDTQGRAIAFHDLDADLILLDFWGTWCGPCIKSIPHLVEIQKTLGGKKMQVIGIACEDTPPQVRTARVGQKVKQLGINYPVLVTSRDGTCPLQDAFQIQFYPTMILLDRQGHILWREQGATDVTLARMDRFITRNLHRPSSGNDGAQHSQVARSGN